MTPSGEPELADIYLKYVRRVRGYLYRLTGSPDAAEELTQEVFYRAFRRFVTGVEVRYVSAWLYRVARNLWLDHLRRHGGCHAKAGWEPAALCGAVIFCLLDKATSPRH
ncbi:MAG: RNA polymerase sigma factor [Firmicutes bacterium]|nr:RNA polymerase sigma factor [Bacillota bacterium]